ncbi:RFC checkpoint protein Rad17 [Exophiala xenobiotica]|uniref:RFC checkpoint protein Rad17 n=1 Tax=Lithohypha guttulata TaxID=1690604 RepID=A0ABR0KJK1_9EURO|nr:RFC checkpoint protein Rad17 [Lithohypha guttulata]KAK5324618.1 RFC checkpoint protein Rad17 [Exophiala xenobiotica]
MPSNPRPVKRQRRSTVVLSDDDGEPGPSRVLPLRRSDVASTRAAIKSPLKSNGAVSKQLKKEPGTAPKRSLSAKSSPKSSPEKSRSSKKLTIDDTKNKSLHTFFNKASEEERWRKRSATPDVGDAEETLQDDIIDDESMDEAFAEAIRRSEKDMVKQEPPSSSLKVLPALTKTTAPPTSSQKFKKPALPKKAVADTSHELITSEVGGEVAPWAERYGPTNLDELAVHKKKVQDVQKWLDDAIAGRSRQRLLVLKGPAGSGKSTTIDILTKVRRYELVNWQNPDTSEAGVLSSSLQFAEFVTRGGNYGALSLGDLNNWSPNPNIVGRVLLVEEFPAAMTRSSDALESFRSVLLHAATNAGPTMPFGRSNEPSGPPPIVLIISETLVSSSTAFTDSFTAQRLLGAELMNHPAVCVIEFNPVAPTFIAKALDTAIKKEARDSRRRRIPGPAVLHRLAEMGDVRNAINSLQLLCTHGDDNGDWSGTVAANAKRSSRSIAPLSKFEQNSLRLISARETTLDMFHAAGKVCYNKREDPRVSDTRAEPPPKPPDHLMDLYRPKVSQVNTEELLNETGTDIQTFVSTVHQNYILSCNNDDFVDYFDGCAAILSDAELLDPDSRGLSRSKARAHATRSMFQLGTSDSLRQDEISFQVATRGVLFNLPFPVSRAAPPGAGRGGAFKMYYPASLRLWRPIEEMEGLLELTIAQISGQKFRPMQQGQDVAGVSTWKSRASAFETQPAVSEDVGDSIPRTDLNKDHLILDILPYMTKIDGARGEDITTLKKITHLRGFNAVTEEPDDDPAGDVQPASARLTQKVEAAHQSLQLENQRTQQVARKQSTDEPPVERLFIEDDDIQDSD